MPIHHSFYVVLYWYLYQASSFINEIRSLTTPTQLEKKKQGLLHIKHHIIYLFFF